MFKKIFKTLRTLASRSNRLLGKWWPPFVLKKKYDLEIEKLKQQHKVELEKKSSEYHLEIEKAKEDLQRILPKMINIDWDYLDSPFQSYRLIVEFHERMIRESLEWGNDQRFLDYMAEDIGRRAIYELKSMNFMRYSRKRD